MNLPVGLILIILRKIISYNFFMVLWRPTRFNIAFTEKYFADFITAAVIYFIFYVFVYGIQ